jgi:hypothetical protein
VEAQRQLLMKNTQKLLLLPYHCDNWLLRSNDLMELGFPELAAGDAYKSILLSEAALDYDSVGLGENARLQFGMDVFIRSPTSVRDLLFVPHPDI